MGSHIHSFCVHTHCIVALEIVSQFAFWSAEHLQLCKEVSHILSVHIVEVETVPKTCPSRLPHKKKCPSSHL